MSIVYTVNVELGVDYSQAYLVDEKCESPLDFEASSDVGIILPGEGTAQLIFGFQYGTAPFTVAVADSDPGPDLDGYEDIVEIAFDSPSGRLTLEEWGDARSHPVPPLTAGPGAYRLRYHVLGMDEEEMEMHYLLQIWPEAYREPVVVKSTTEYFRYWLNAW
ncbi:hypothetical protein [Herbidospora daliensis]|uniref:hypothetical protein n=1 Tax=Herbidospora daliensis TaxID=295585 RepID=UPI000784AD24|nr:hypothetical protein [Herbidospora daliensis]